MTPGYRHNGDVGEIILLRHGQTEWSASGRHTSRTDVPLTGLGEAQAAAVRPVLAERTIAAVWSSPRGRARRTADLAGLTGVVADDDLAEWDYGRYEGLTSPQIHEHRPDWDLWHDGCPDGERPDDVGRRVDRVLERARPLLDHGDVVLVGHGHALRAAGARWAGLPAAAGAVLMLDTATVSVLGFEHGRPALHRWNAPAG